MTRHANRLWAVILLLGCFADYLFWKQSIGVNFAIFIAISLLGGLIWMLNAGLKPRLKTLWLVIPFGFFAIVTFLRQEPLTRGLAYTFTLGSAGLMAASYLGGRWVQYNLLEYFRKFFQLTGSILSRQLKFVAQINKEEAERSELRKKIPVKPILRGLAIAFPIMATLTYLLTSADAIFNQILRQYFSSGHIRDFIAQAGIILSVAYVLAGVFLHAATQSKDEKLLGEDEPIIKPFLGFTESAIIMASVTVLFGAFVLIQFQYFFGGRTNIGIQGYTYSQYARSGFNELIEVAFISLLLILGLSTVTRRVTEWQRRIYSGLSVAIVALVLVILVSAYQRLALAIDWHGFSRLRVYPRIFLIWVGILFVTVVALEIVRRERYFALAALLASMGFAASLSLMNVDASIVQVNVLRATQGKHFNVNYLSSLSTDAIPALADEFMDASLTETIHEGIGAALVCYQNSQIAESDPEVGWQSTHFSQQNAAAALAEVEKKLRNYKLNTSISPPQVHTPGNKMYVCGE